MKLLIADDEQSIARILKDTLSPLGASITCVDSGDQALQELQNTAYDLALLDIRMPGKTGLEVLAEKATFAGNTAIIVITAQDTMENAVEAMKQGAFDYLTKPFDLDEVTRLSELALGGRERFLDSARNDNGSTRNDGRSAQDDGHSTAAQTIVGSTPAMTQIFKTIGKVASQNVTVLIQGESGTGKELVARALHENSGRNREPFVTVNCSAIPADILESELFGHKKGAFTGAIADKVGFFEQANGGTIFLDEIGEMPLLLQAKILRFLQDQTIQRVGDTTAHSLNVRVIAATNRDLETEVSAGRFREDLFFRLNVVPLWIPPLRERTQDIPRLIAHFLNRYSVALCGHSKQFEAQALKHLTTLKWPGNVRELENIVKRLIVLSRSQVITKSDILEILEGEDHTQEISLEGMIEEQLSELIAALDKPLDLYKRFLPKFEKPLIESALKRSGGNQLQAAEYLGINRNTLRKKIKEMNIKI